MPDESLIGAIRRCVRACVLHHGFKEARRILGVSHHTLWRLLERNQVGRAISKAVLDTVGQTVEALDAATEQEIATARKMESARPESVQNLVPLPQGQHDALLSLCAAPLTTISELSRFTRVPSTTLRARLERLVAKGLADFVSHRLDSLGQQPQRRYFPTAAGLTAAARAELGLDAFLRAYPVSRRWFRLLTERLDSVAVLYHIAALVADADRHGTPVRVDYYRQGPYDMLITLSRGRSVGIVRQGATLPSAHLRYRLRTIDNLHYDQRPMVTLVIACSDHANRRAVRTLGNPLQHHTLFVATEGKLLAGDHHALVWQQCGNGMGDNPPVEISSGVSLDTIVGWTDQLLEIGDEVRRKHNDRAERLPKPDPDTLYPDHLRAAMPAPSAQVKAALAVQLTPGEKNALDLLAAWPLASTTNLAGLMGGVTQRRANQVLQSLTQRGLVRTNGTRHVLTDAGLTYLARRDRAAERIALGRWSPRLWRPRAGAGRVYAGSALRTLAAQLHHQDAITCVAAACPLNVLVARPMPWWSCCPPTAPASATPSAVTPTWCTPTPPSGWHTGADPVPTSSRWSAGLSPPSGPAPAWRTTVGTSPAAGQSGTTVATRLRCSSSSRPPTTRTRSYPPPRRDPFPCSPPTSRSLRSSGSSVTCGTPYGRTIAHGCPCAACMPPRLDHPSSSGLPVGGLPPKLLGSVSTLSDPKRRKRRPRVAERRPRRRRTVPRTRPRPRVRSRRGASGVRRAHPRASQ